MSFIIGCQAMWSEVRVKQLIFIVNVVYSISYDLLLNGYKTCYIGLLYWEDYPYCFGSYNAGLHLGIVHSICLIATKLGKVVANREWICNPFEFCTGGGIYVCQTFLIHVLFCSSCISVYLVLHKKYTCNSYIIHSESQFFTSSINHLFVRNY